MLILYSRFYFYNGLLISYSKVWAAFAPLCSVGIDVVQSVVQAYFRACCAPAEYRHSSPVVPNLLYSRNRTYKRISLYNDQFYF